MENIDIFERVNEIKSMLKSIKYYSNIIKIFDLNYLPGNIEKFIYDENAPYIDFGFFMDSIVNKMKSIKIAGLFNETKYGYTDDIIDESTIYWMNDSLSVPNEEFTDESKFSIFDAVGIVHIDNRETFLVLDSYCDESEKEDQFLQRRKNTFGIIVPYNGYKYYLECVTNDGIIVHYFLIF